MSQLPRTLRWTAGFLLVLGALGALAYWQFPRLVQGTAVRMLTAYDIELHALAVARPSTTGWVIRQLHVSSGEYQLRARELELGYTLAELWRGQLTSVAIQTLTVLRLATQAQTSEPVESTTAALPARLDPAYWLAQLPWRSLTVQQLGLADPQAQLQLSGHVQQDRRSLAAVLTATTPQAYAGQQFTLSYTPASGLQVAMTDSDGAAPVRVTSRFGPAVMDLQLDADIQGPLARLLAISLGAPEINFAARLSARSRVPWPLPGDYDLQSLTVLGQLDLDLTPAPDLSLAKIGGLFALRDGELTWTLDSGRLAWVDTATATKLDCQLSEPLLARVDITQVALSDGLVCHARTDADALQFDLRSLDYRWPQVATTEPGTLAFDLDFAGALQTIGPVAGGLQMTVFQVSAEQIQGRGALSLQTPLLTDPGVTQQHPVPVRLRYWPVPGKGELQLDLQLPLAERLLGTLGMAATDETDVGPGQLSGSATVDWHPQGFTLALDGSLNALQVFPGRDLPPLRPLDGAFELVLKDAALTASAQLALAGLQLPLQLQADLDAGSGSVRSEFDWSLTRALLETLTTDWQMPVDLLGGQLAGWIQMDWQAEVDTQVRGLVQLTDGAGYFDSYLASGMRGDLQFSRSAERTEASLTPLQIADLDVGFPVTAITADLDVRSTGEGFQLELGSVTAAVLGGEANIAKAQINLTDSSGGFPVTLSGLSLAEVLALEGEDITGNGVLDGQLPVRLSPGGVAVVGGLVQARPPGGKIHVGEDFTAPTGQPGLDFAVQALADFQYSALDAAVDYAEDGELLLAVKLRGSNPAVEKGRAIHYNVNITENVPSLLESLQADARLTERIQNKLERKMNR